MEPLYQPSGRAFEYAPLALNLYRGCSHACTYCYAPSATRSPREDFAQAVPRAGVIEALETQLSKGRIPNDSPAALLCFTCDPYQPCDREYGLAGKAIDILHRYGLGAHVLTKGGFRAYRDFTPWRHTVSGHPRRSMLGDHDEDAFACTLTFTEEEQSREWEPLAAPPRERIEALKEAHDRDIRTWASMEPVIDPEQSLELIAMAAPYVDLFKVGRWNHDARANAIDWKDFGHRAVNLLTDLGKDYYIKDDLRRILTA
jgi:DNA repair photolyase